MAKRIFIAAAILAGLMAGLFSLQAQPKQTGKAPELTCFISDPDENGKTNIRDKPGGKVLFQVEGQSAIVVTVVVQPGGWWRIKDPEAAFGDEHKIPASGCWIHRSVLAVCTDNADAHYRVLRTEPRIDAPRIGFIPQFIALLRPLEMTADGQWVKVTYEPGDFPGRTKEKMTGWIQTVFTCEEDIESGDGYGFPWMYAYARPEKDVALLQDPGLRKQTYVMEKGKDYLLWIGHPRNGFWEVLGESLYCGDKDVELDDYSCVPASAIRMRVVDNENNATVALYSEANEESKVVARLKVGTEVHPLDHTTDRSVWGAEPILVQVTPVGKPDVTGWVEIFHLSAAPAPSLTLDEVAGTYILYNPDGSVDERIVLTPDGDLRWSYADKTDYLEYPFVIRGYGIYQNVEEADAQARPDYVFNPADKTISTYSRVYYRQK